MDDMFNSEVARSICEEGEANLRLVDRIDRKSPPPLQMPSPRQQGPTGEALQVEEPEEDGKVEPRGKRVAERMEEAKSRQRERRRAISPLRSLQPPGSRHDDVSDAELFASFGERYLNDDSTLTELERLDLLFNEFDSYALVIESEGARQMNAGKRQEGGGAKKKGGLANGLGANQVRGGGADQGSGEGRGEGNQEPPPAEEEGEQAGGGENSGQQNPVVAFNRRGIEGQLRVDSPFSPEGVADLVLEVVNKSPAQLKDFAVFAAVSKQFTVELAPASSSSLAAGGDSTITQKIRIVRVAPGGNVRLNLKATYTMNGKKREIEGTTPTLF